MPEPQIKLEKPPEFLNLCNLASETTGAKVLFATDDFFAPAEWMLHDSEPVFIENKYTEYGKWMDGWETRRKRIAGHDWCIISLAAPCRIRGIMVDTAHFTGNFAPRISVQAAQLTPEEEKQFPPRKETMGAACSEIDLKTVSLLNSNQWTEVISPTKLWPGYEETRKHFFPVNSTQTYTHVRLNMFPDGGIARFRVYGEIRIPPSRFQRGVELDLLALDNGGSCVGFSNAHFGHPWNLIKPGASKGMFDGWETARRLDRPKMLSTDEKGILQVSGMEWSVFRLGTRGSVRRIVVDTSHFKGNYPDSVRIEAACLQKDEEEKLATIKWRTLLRSQKLSANREHAFESVEIEANDPVTHVRVIMAPDGGIARVRMFGVPDL